MKGFGFPSYGRPLLFSVAWLLAAGCSSNRPESEPSAELVAGPSPAPPLETRVEPRRATTRQSWEDGEEPRPDFEYLDQKKEDGWAAEGLWIGAFASYGDVLGDFDDEDVLVGPNDITILPDVEADAGIGGMLSYRWLRYELAISYEAFNFEDSEFGGNTHKTKFYYLDLMFRNYFLVKTPIQPYLTAGAGWSRATVEDGTTDGIDTEKAEYEDGITINVGAGLAFYPVPWVSFFGHGLWRFGRFQSVDSLDGKDSRKVDSDAWEVSAGVSFRLLPGR